MLNGILALMVLLFASLALLVSVLFSAIVTERRVELGLLKAIGTQRSQARWYEPHASRVLERRDSTGECSCVRKPLCP